jgi:hypothetical protein
MDYRSLSKGNRNNDTSPKLANKSQKRSPGVTADLNAVVSFRQVLLEACSVFPRCHFHYCSFCVSRPLRETLRFPKVSRPFRGGRDAKPVFRTSADSMLQVPPSKSL